MPVPEEGEAVWLDLAEPRTRAEEAAVERMLGIDVPTREEYAGDRAVQPGSMKATARCS